MTLWALPLLPLISGLLLAAFGPERRAALAWIAGAVLAATLALAGAAVAGGWTAALAWSETLVLTARLVPVSAAVALLVPLVALPIAVHAALNEEGPGLARLVGGLLAFTGGMLLVVVADDLLTVLIGWEVIGAVSWALIGHDWRAGAPASGLYAFVVTRAGDLGLFVALMALFAATGSASFEGLAALDGWPLVLVAYGVALSAVSKAGQMPFSPWLFRAMAGPSSVSALLHAATLVAAGAYLAARLEPELARAPGWGGALIAVGLVTAIAGGVVAAIQEHAKKLLAASTSAQLGLMLVAVGAGYPGVAVLHLIAHALFKAPLFLAAGLAGHRAGGYGLGAMRLGRAMPITALLVAVAAAALAAVPPLGGAWTKEEIVSATGHLDWLLAALVILAGGLSAAYALRFALLAYGPGASPEGAGEDEERGPEPERAAEWLPLGALALATAVLSALWWPGAHDPAARLLGAELPSRSAAELAASLTALALGLLAGLWLARNRREVMLARSEWLAEWLGLPWLLDAGVRAPVDRLALTAARIDDRALDAVPRAAGWLARRGVAWLARGDDRAVDGGVRGTAAFGEWLARAGARFGEAAADGLPSGAGALAAMSGRDLRGLQSGLSHQYYSIAVGGLALAAAILAGF